MEKLNNSQKFYDQFERMQDILGKKEVLQASLKGESSDFVRFSCSKVRQSTRVEQGDVTLTLSLDKKVRKVCVPLVDFLDWSFSRKLIEKMREERKLLPDDPYFTASESCDRSETNDRGLMPVETEVFNGLREHAEDAAGLLSCGPVFRGYANSRGARQWFSSESFSVDFSLYSAKQKAVKGLYAGRDWDARRFSDHLKRAGSELALMERPRIKLGPGKYDVYLGPQAVGEILGLMSWGALSYDSWKRGKSPFHKLCEKSAILSSDFNLYEDFASGYCPRFNEKGETSSSRISLVSEGKLETLLINDRSAKEYGVNSNKANEHEGLRATVISEGRIPESRALKHLGTGIAISNLHYLNWSDVLAGRFTGMTRYACFWIENGVNMGPVEDMRFDETLFHLFGEGLDGLTDRKEVLPFLDSYGGRQVGAFQCPGAVVRGKSFTL